MEKLQLQQKKYTSFLILGGLYFVLSLLLYVGSGLFFDILDLILFALFFFYLLKLAFTNKKIILIAFLYKKYPRFSHYLIYLGWIPYVYAGILLALIAIGYIFPEQSNHFMLQGGEILLKRTFNYGFSSLILLSLVFAFIRKNK